MSAPRLIELSLAGFDDRLAERTATPGGGSVAAHQVCLGAALCAMALRFTSGERYAAVQELAQQTAARLDQVRAQALPLIDRDAQAYDAVSQARKLPKQSEAEQAARKQAIQSALKGALEVPLETLGAALSVLESTAPLAGRINPNLASDCVSGSWCLRAGLEAAYLNVRINALDISDRPWVESRLAQAQERLSRGRELSEAVRAAAEQLLT